ncbi:peroxisome assembly protein 26 [Lampris incognitus]|uniref:peroxisome assembly protein 26 n=1 Tax=Lampris incognitus TaxID=2546036 RepID=UPI0024B5B32A|nr:peroxisome assembly protein 26 [Lampris incognitus]
MTSSSSTSLAHTCSFGSVRQSPSLSSDLAQTLCSLDTAADQLMIHKDFQAAFDTCDKALAHLATVENEDSRYGEFKAGLCLLGIQALAELNQWRGVLVWILQHYECQDKIPAKIMQMCILLYTKVSEQALMHETARCWLHCPSNSRVVGFGTVAELYLLHVLLPLGHVEEAHELILGEVGSCAFTEDQRHTAVAIVEEKASQSQDPPPNPSEDPSPDTTGRAVSPQGTVIQKLKAIVSFLYRRLSMASVGSFTLRRVFLAVVLLFVLFVRMDPALPSSFLWISKLLRLLQ